MKPEDFKSKVSTLNQAIKDVSDVMDGLVKSIKVLNQEKDQLGNMTTKARDDFRKADSETRSLKADFETFRTSQTKELKERWGRLDEGMKVSDARFAEAEKNRLESTETLRQNKIILERNKSLQDELAEKLRKANELTAAIR